MSAAATSSRRASSQSDVRDRRPRRRWAAAISSIPRAREHPRARRAGRLLERRSRSAVAWTSIRRPSPRHDDVHVHLGGRVLPVVEVEERLPVDDPDARRPRSAPWARQSHARARRARGRPRRPVIAAVRVPPSAWRTSQSSQTVRSPSVGEVVGRRRIARPIEALDLDRAALLAAGARLAADPLAGRSGEHPVLGGEPAPGRGPRASAGRPSSTVAVQRTRVRPSEMSAEPWACSRKFGTISSGRSSSGRRPSRLTRPHAPARGGRLRDRVDRELEEPLAERARTRPGCPVVRKRTGLRARGRSRSPCARASRPPRAPSRPRRRRASSPRPKTRSNTGRMSG